MDKKEISREEMKQYVENWKRANEKIDEVKREDMQKPDYVQRTLESMAPLFEYAIAHSQHSNTTGLLEWQRLIIKWKHKSDSII